MKPVLYFVLGLALTGLMGATVYNQFSPGGALSGTWNSQNVNLAAGPPFIAGILPASVGGTANGFTAFTGPTTGTKTFTLPDASATLLTSNALVSVPQGGTGLGTLPVHGVLLGEGTSTVSNVAALAADTLLQGQGVTADPAAVSLLNCGDATHALGYSTSTHTFACQAISALATPVTVPNGGTGVATLPVHGVLLGEGTSTVSNVAALAADTLLQGQGVTADPAAVAVNNCGSSTQALSYSTTTHAFGCQTISGSGASVLTAAKPSGTSRANTSTNTADPDLTFASEPSGTYSVICYLDWNINTNGATYTINTTGTLTRGTYSNTVSDQAADAFSPVVQNVNGGNSTTSATGAPAQASRLTGTVVQSTTGTISVNWSQRTNNATAVTLNQGSWCQLIKLL